MITEAMINGCGDRKSYKRLGLSSQEGVDMVDFKKL